MFTTSGKIAKRVLLSPVRLIGRQVRPGSVNSSVFSLVIICLGAGTTMAPSIFYYNGTFLASILILLLAFISFYTGYLIAYCAAITGGWSYEEIAYRLYGKKGLQFTSFCNILCNVGFLIGYLCLFKTTMPSLLIELFGREKVPIALDDSDSGKALWAAIFCFILLFLSLPR